jgi:hypothetical protein
LSAISPSAVGSTQLKAPGIHGQPFKSGSSVVVRARAKTFQTIQPSHPKPAPSCSISHCRPRTATLEVGARFANAITAGAVDHELPSTAGVGAQPPSAFWARPSHDSPSSTRGCREPRPTAAMAMTAAAVASVLLGPPSFGPQPPSRFCAARSASVSSLTVDARPERPVARSR